MTTEKDTGLHPPVDPGTVEHPPADVTLESLAALKHLPESELREHGCSPRKHNGKPAVTIPYHDGSGGTLAVRFRTALHKDCLLYTSDAADE